MKSLTKPNTNRLALHLILTHLIVSGVTALMMGTLGWPFFVNETSIVVALVLSLLLGFGLNATILRGVAVTQNALYELNLGKKVKPHNISWRWPLSSLLTQIEDLTGQNHSATQLRHTLTQQVREAAAVEERNKLARDLHDSIKQQIFTIHVSVTAAQTHWERDPESAQTALTAVRQAAKEASVEMDALLQQLRPAPLEKVGLVEALREQLEALSYRTGAEVTSEFGNLPTKEQLPGGTETTFFRIAQEALSNIARHARATKIHLRLRVSNVNELEQLKLEILDNGQGFDEDTVARGMGLGNMKSRTESLGGKFDMTSTLNKGTVIQVLVPLIPEDSFQKDSKIFQKFLEEANFRKIKFWIPAISALLFVGTLRISLDETIIGLIDSLSTLTIITWFAYFIWHIEKVAHTFAERFPQAGKRVKLEMNAWILNLKSIGFILAGIWLPMCLLYFRWGSGIASNWPWATILSISLLIIAFIFSIRANMVKNLYYHEVPLKQINHVLQNGFNQNIIMMLAWGFYLAISGDDRLYVLHAQTWFEWKFFSINFFIFWLLGSRLINLMLVTSWRWSIYKQERLEGIVDA
jgi:signal transduction histidine kinase